LVTERTPLATQPTAGPFCPGSRVALIAALAAIACGVWVSPAGAGTIGRAKVDGSGVERSFIRTPKFDPAAGLRHLPWWMAVDRTHLYWWDGYAPPPITIERAELDGSRLRTLIPGDLFPNAFAVGAGHIYWVWGGSAGGIARARLDGSGVEPRFIPASAQVRPYDLAVGGDHIYWTSTAETSHVPDGPPPASAAIGRAKLDGTDVEPAFVTEIGGFPSFANLAVDDRYLYWATGTSSPLELGPYPISPWARGVRQIGRARLDGSGVERNFISGLRVTGYGIAVDRRHVYWTDLGAGRIGRARKDGSHVEKAFIRVPYGVIDVAVEGKHLYWTSAFTPAGTVTAAIRGTSLPLTGDPRCGVLDPGPPRPLYRACLASVKLTCPTADDWPCTGSIRLVTANPIRYRGKTRRIRLATAGYTMVSETQTVELTLSKPKAALVLNHPSARTVRAIAKVVGAKVTTTTKRMRMSVAP
jgi:hypothetical protein